MTLLANPPLRPRSRCHPRFDNKGTLHLCMNRMIAALFRPWWCFISCRVVWGGMHCTMERFRIEVFRPSWPRIAKLEEESPRGGNNGDGDRRTAPVRCGKGMPHGHGRYGLTFMARTSGLQASRADVAVSRKDLEQFTCRCLWDRKMSLI